ncbi:MAG: alpha/beta fold hydrolase, partial [Plesiomonas shigelloides]
MHALCYGHTKPTLLFLHGLGTNSTDWQPQLSAFSPYYRVLAPDLPGHGQSEPLTSHRGIPEMTRALSRWLLTQNCGPVIVIGLSLGALVGLELLLKHPHQVLHAILINGTTDLRLTD